MTTIQVNVTVARRHDFSDCFSGLQLVKQHILKETGFTALILCVSITFQLLIHFLTFSNDAGKYALYCSRSIERTISEGDREARPSRPEVGISASFFSDGAGLPHSKPLAN